MPVITEENASQRLLQIAEYISADAAKAGRLGSMTHGDIKIQGWGYDKFLTVENVNVTLSPRTSEGSAQWGITAPDVNVRLDPLHSRRQIFRANSPLKLMENDKPSATISFGTPVRIGFLGGLPNKLQSMLITVRLPGQMIITPEPSAEGDTPKPTIISYEGLPEINIRNLPATGEREAKYEFRNITIEKSDDTSITIGAIANDVYESTNQDKRIEGKYTLTVSDFTGHDKDKATKTCSLTSNMDYVSDVSLMTLMGIPAGGKIDMKVNKLVIACDDFGVKVDGAVSREIDDPLPVGQLNISIENIKAFLASNLISDKTRSELMAALPRMTGQSMDSLTSVKIAVKREKNGVIQLGKATANEVSITLLADLMQAIKDAHNPAIIPSNAVGDGPAATEVPLGGVPNEQ